MRLFLFGLSAVILGLLSTVWISFRHEMAALRPRLDARSVTVETSIGTVEYALDGDGPPVLAIHGSGGGFDQGLEMAGSLAAKGFRLIAPSRFGYLRSSYPENLTLEMQADVFAELLDRIKIEKVFIFGGSAGALSAMQFAIRHPDRCKGLVLLVPAAYAPDRPPHAAAAAKGSVAEAIVMAVLSSDFLFWAAMKVVPDVLTKFVLATEPGLVHSALPEEQVRVSDVLKHILPVSLRAKGILFDARTAGAPSPMDLRSIRCPLLAISAEDDLYGTDLSARFTAGQVPDGKLVIYPTGGHLWVGHDREVWEEIASFLRLVDGKEQSPRGKG